LTCLGKLTFGFFLYLLFYLSPSSHIYSQLNTVWVNYFNGQCSTCSDIPTDIKVTASGRIYVTGYLNWGNVIGYYDTRTICVNSNGVLLWSNSFSREDFSLDYPNDIHIDPLENIYITGYSRKYPQESNQDGMVLKYDSSGVLLWQRFFSSAGFTPDEGVCVVTDSKNNVIIGANYWNAQPSGGSDFAIFKYDPSGKILWSETFDGPDHSADETEAILVSSADEIYLVGTTYSNFNGYDIAVLKYSDSGSLLWSMIHNDSLNSVDIAYSIISDNDNNIYVGGLSSGKMLILKMKPNGTIIRKIKQQYMSAEFMYKDQNSNFYVTGFGSQLNITGYRTIKYDSTGNIIWSNVYGGLDNLNNFPKSLAINHNGFAGVTGRSISSPLQYYDFATVMYDNNGLEVGSKRFGSPYITEETAGCGFDSSGNLYVAGYYQPGGTSEDYCLIKYASVIGITPISAEIPKHFSLSQNYPNPFNPSTTINFSIPKLHLTLSGGDKEGVILKIYDIIGNEITTLVNQQLTPGTYSVDWDASNQPSGVYFYRLVLGDNSQVKKMILLK